MNNQADNWNLPPVNVGDGHIQIDPNGFNEILRCRNGLMIANKNDWPIGTSLREYGEYAMYELEFLKQLIRPESLIVDAGANIGTHTVYFSKLAAHVIAFEPQRISYQTLCANVALNNCVNVHAFNAAVGHEEGIITVPVRDQYAPNNFGGVPLAGVTEGEPVRKMTIDGLNLVRCDMIKADVEGMEAELLVGAKNTIAKFRPALYLEADGAQASVAIKMLMEIGYECYWHVPMLFNQNNFKGNKVDVFKNAEGKPLVSVNMLCLPSEAKIEVKGMKRIESSDEAPYMVISVPVEEANA